ncbi:hypothetical protein QAD02_020894 [Eretmocerus hayati]|uniref:Uncharacterized protein n=1 Tax=Eretmocerus hayati TaxID=131215 RepID=A0ACC2PNM5_9HYME|nr:hypothetical protein QAD02_020894 [Eretmocerus hayati]
MPNDARRWLPGAPGGWFPSPDAVVESSDSEESLSSGPSPKRPCLTPSRASTEPDAHRPQGSGPTTRSCSTPSEEPCVSPTPADAPAGSSSAMVEATSEIQGRRASTLREDTGVSSSTTGFLNATTSTSDEAAAATSSSQQVRSETCPDDRSHAMPSTSLKSRAQRANDTRNFTRTDASAGPSHRATRKREREERPSCPPSTSAAPQHGAGEPVHCNPPREVQCVDLISSDDDENEVRVLFENSVNPRVNEMPRTIRFDHERFQDLVNEYQATLNPRIGAQIRRMTTVQDARTQHREVVRRGRENRRRQEQLAQEEQMQLIAELADGILVRPAPVPADDHPAPPPVPIVVDVPAGEVAAAPANGGNVMDAVFQLPLEPMARPAARPVPAEEIAAAPIGANTESNMAAPSSLRAEETNAPRDAAPRAAIEENAEPQVLDLSVRAPAAENPEAVYRLEPMPQVRDGERHGLRFVLRRVAGEQPIAAAIAEDPAIDNVRRQQARENPVPSPDDRIWRDIVNAVRGDDAD